MVIINRKENPSECLNDHEVWLWSSNYHQVLWGVLKNRKLPKNVDLNDHLVWNILSRDFYRVLWGVLINRKIPKNEDVKIGKRSFIIKAWHTKFRVDYLWGSDWYIIRNISTGNAYTIKRWEEKILWKLWDILVDGDDTQASREHLKLRVDGENNLFLHDISTNWTFIGFNTCWN